MRRFLLFPILLVLAAPALSHSHACTGAADCRVCKNCRYCKHCAHEGGTCGVCRPAIKKTQTAPQKAARKHHKRLH